MEPEGRTGRPMGRGGCSRGGRAPIAGFRKTGVCVLALSCAGAVSVSVQPRWGMATPVLSRGRLWQGNS